MATTGVGMPAGGGHDEIGGVHVRGADGPCLRRSQVVPFSVEDAVGGGLALARPQPAGFLSDVEVVAEMPLSESVAVAGISEAFGGELSKRLQETVTGAAGAAI